MKKVLLMLSTILLVAGCANSNLKSYKASPIEGKKTVIVEEIVEETSDTIIGERTKKVIKRTPTTSSAITLTENSSFEDENFALNFKFNSNNIDVTIKNKKDTDASFFTDYSYYLTPDSKKYRMILLESWKGNNKLINSQQSLIIAKNSTITLNLTPESCIDFSAGTGSDNYVYWQKGSLNSVTLGKKAVNDYVEFLIPIKSESNIFAYLFKVKLTK